MCYGLKIVITMLASSSQMESLQNHTKDFKWFVVKWQKWGKSWNTVEQESHLRDQKCDNILHDYKMGLKHLKHDGKVGVEAEYSEMAEWLQGVWFLRDERQNTRNPSERKSRKRRRAREEKGVASSAFCVGDKLELLWNGTSQCGCDES